MTEPKLFKLATEEQACLLRSIIIPHFLMLPVHNSLRVS